MRFLDGFLITESTPNGIVSFELAKDLDKSIAMINSWNPVAKTAAGLSMGFDFLFLIIYSFFISLLVFKLNKKFFGAEGNNKLGEIFLIIPFIAAFFDILENITLIKLLLGDLQQQWSSLAYYFATIKFVLLFIAIAYILIGGVVILFKQKR